MAGPTDESLSPREAYLKHLFDVMTQNEAFLHENVKEVYTEVVGLTNDAIDYVGCVIGSGAGRENYVESAMIYFLIHVLAPVGGAVYLNALAGNLPGCYMELRLALESLVKCHLADMQYSAPAFSLDRLRLLEKQAKKEGKSTSRLMGEWDKFLGLKKGSVALWGKLSQGWVHARGIMEGIVDRIIRESDTPAWGLVVPQAYTANDVVALNDFRKRLAQFRFLLRAAMESYRQAIGWDRA